MGEGIDYQQRDGRNINKRQVKEFIPVKAVQKTDGGEVSEYGKGCGKRNGSE